MDKDINVENQTEPTNEGSTQTQTQTQEEVKTVSKEDFDKVMREAKEYKEKWKKTLGEQDRIVEEQKEREAEILRIENENKSLKMTNALSPLGLEQLQVAEIVASAVAGNLEDLSSAITKAFETQKAKYENQIKNLQLETTEKPIAGNNRENKSVDVDLANMDLDKLQALLETNPELAKKYVL